MRCQTMGLIDNDQCIEALFTFERFFSVPKQLLQEAFDKEGLDSLLPVSLGDVGWALRQVDHHQRTVSPRGLAQCRIDYLERSLGTGAISKKESSTLPALLWAIRGPSGQIRLRLLD